MAGGNYSALEVMVSNRVMKAYSRSASRRHYAVKSMAIGFVLVIVSCCRATSAQCAPPVMCPRQQVLEFLQWDFSGVLFRVTTEDSGFNHTTASQFFLKYDVTLPKEAMIWVISPEYAVDDVSIEGSRAEVYFGFEPFGHIDGALQWHAPDPRIMKYADMFHLSLSDKRWEAGADGKTIPHPVNPPQWLITDPAPLYLNVEAAIRYVAGRREQTADPTLRKNADATLVTLKKLKP
jgi:hypothetical protein